MTGRRTVSILLLGVGMISIFLPIVTISESRFDTGHHWSVFSICSGVFGYGTEHFYDIAAALVYPDTSSEKRTQNTSSSHPQPQDSLGFIAAWTSLGATFVSYALLLLSAAVAIFKYAPKRLYRLGIIGAVGSLIAIAGSLVVIEQLGSSQAGSFGGGINLGAALYVLLACFILLTLAQRIEALDKHLSAPDAA